MNDKNTSNMKQHEDKVYAAEQLSLQKCYEQWCCKEKWLLHREGIPLLLGFNPNERQALDKESLDKVDTLWTHAKECVQKKLLPVINIEFPEEEWEVSPLELHSWGTVSRIAMPDEFNMLMAFVAQTIKPEVSSQNNSQDESAEGMLYQKHREIVLGAAMSLLVNAVGLFKNKKGKIVSNKIAKNIMENEDQWFGEDRPLLSEATMTDLIDEYIKLTKPMV